jgi:hypothetical protein
VDESDVTCVEEVKMRISTRLVHLTVIIVSVCGAGASITQDPIDEAHRAYLKASNRGR